MSVKWTENQIKAINSSGNNILVSAAAGSGKTAVLVERVIRLITDKDNPVSIDKILMVTFTNAAAAEMKTRIYKAIKNCIEKDPGNINLHNQLTLLSQAQISTIHAFCQNLLRDNFYKVGLSSDFSLIDNVYEAELKEKIAEKVIDEGYELYPDEVDALVSLYGGRFDDAKLKKMIINLYKFIQCQPYPEAWFEEMVQMYADDFNKTKWAEFAVESFKTELKDLIGCYEDMLKSAQAGGVESYIAVLTSEQKQLEEGLSKTTDWDSVKCFADNFVFGRMPNKTKGCDEASVSYVKNLRDNCKKEFKKIKNCFCETADVISKEINNQYPVINCLRNLTVHFAEIYKQEKKEINSLDFDDLLHLTLNTLLEDEEYLQSLREKFDEILVDEFQDTNGVNVAIFEKISKGNNLFMVGDVKQSIYGFLNARPESFIERYESYSEDCNEKGQKISLSNNFRSAENVLAFSNHLFKKLMTKDSSGIDYTDDQKLVYSNETINSSLPVEVHVLDTLDEFGFSVDQDKVGNEAYFTAKRILSLVEIEKPLVYDSSLKEERPIRYSDIAVLARSVKGETAVEFTKNLALFGIPVTCEETGSYLMTVEIMTVISFLKLIDNPYQDIPMLAVMRSPMFSFDENELAEIKSSMPKEHFYKAVMECKSDKVVKFLEVLNSFIEFSKKESIEQLIEKILSETGYYSFVGLLPDGIQRMANLKLLSRRANIFEQQGKKSIFEYINYINAMVDSGNEYKTAKTISDSDNVVRVMTIHKSKGLEYPAVFVIQAGKRLACKNSLSEIPALFNADLGIGIDYVNGMLKYQSVPQTIIKKQTFKKELAEEIRVLYVALTRAKNFLCIIGSMPNADKKVESLIDSQISMNFINNANSVLDWIVASCFDLGVVKTHGITDILSDAPFVENNKPIEKEICSITAEMVNERLCYSYKHMDATNMPAKVSVSELVAEKNAPHLNKLDDNFGKLTKANRGTVMHFIMQALDLSKTNYDEVLLQVDEMYNKGMLTKTEKEVVDISAIVKFFETDMGIRLKNSQKVLREYSFCTEISSDLLYESGNETDMVLVQGTVDCCFIENGSIVILDYKTGVINEAYEKQIKLYSLCLEKIFNLPVKETKLVSLL